MFNVLVVHMCSVRQSHTKSLILFLFVFWEILYSHGLFIRYTFLVPGWTRFFFQDCSKSQWHRNNGERMWSMLSWQQHTVIDLSAAHPSYRSPISLHAEDALLIWDPVLSSELAVMFGLGWLETPQRSRLIEAVLWELRLFEKLWIPSRHFAACLVCIILKLFIGFDRWLFFCPRDRWAISAAAECCFTLSLLHHRHFYWPSSTSF